MSGGELASLISGGGGIAITLLFIYELYAPRYGIDTSLAGLTKMPDKVDSLQDEQEEIREDLEGVKEDVGEISKQNEISMQVQRAQARANDQMDEERVDEYLLQNGVDVDEFLRGDEMTGYANWKADNAEDET